MNRNTIEIEELSEIIEMLKDRDKISQFLNDMLTESELVDLTKRWRILKMLKDGVSQREISKELGVSLCKVTRGSKILRNEKSIITQYLKGEKNDYDKI